MFENVLPSISLNTHLQPVNAPNRKKKVLLRPPNLQEVLRNKAFCNWFVGFCDGESSFSSGKDKPRKIYLPRFKICIQGDEALLRDFEKRFRIGYFRHDWQPLVLRDSGKPYGRRGDWDIHGLKGISHCLFLVKFFEKNKLRSHKRGDFKIWRKLVLAVRDFKPYEKLGADLPPQEALSLLDLSVALSARRIKGRSAEARRQMNQWHELHQKAAESQR